MRAGNEQQQVRWLPKLAAGELVATVVFTDPNGGPSSTLRLASGPGGGLRLEGTSGFVSDGALAQLLIAVAHDEAGEDAVVVLPRARLGIEVARVLVLDPTRSLAHVTFRSCEIAPEDVLAQGGLATRVIADLRARCNVAMAADSIGIARSVLARTAAYAQQRVQFGHPIGAFQGVKHQCADVFVETEAAATVTCAAADVLADGNDAVGLSSMAKFYACGNAADAAGRAMQLHGGIGYTWESDIHIYLKRAKLNEAMFGDRAFQLDAIAMHLIGPLPEVSAG